MSSENTILVTGGAGYIGSHMVQCAKRAGYTPIVLDNLSTGHSDAVLDAELVVGDMQDTALLAQIFATHGSHAGSTAAPAAHGSCEQAGGVATSGGASAGASAVGASWPASTTLPPVPLFEEEDEDVLEELDDEA